MRTDKIHLSKRLVVVIICIIIIVYFSYLSLLGYSFIEEANLFDDGKKCFTVPDTEMAIVIKCRRITYYSLEIFHIDKRGREEPLYRVINGEVSGTPNVSINSPDFSIHGTSVNRVVFDGEWDIKNNGDGTFTVTNYYEGEAFESQYVIENVKSNVERWQNRKIDQEHWDWINMDCFVLIVMISVLTFMGVRSHRKKQLLCQADGEATEQSAADDTSNNTPPSTE